MSSLHLEGLAITKIYYSPQTPYVTHGQFSVENRGERTAEITVHSVRIRLGEERVEAEGLHLYLLREAREEVGPATVGPGDRASFEVRFPQVDAGRHLHEAIGVDMTVRAGGEICELTSDYTFNIRTRRR